MCFPESHRIRHPALCIGAIAGADAVRSVLVLHILIGHAVFLQGLCKIVVLAGRARRAKRSIVVSAPEIYRRVVTVHGIIQVRPVILPGGVVRCVAQHLIQRFHHGQVHDGVTQQQSTGLLGTVISIAMFLIGKGSHDLSAGRKAHQRIILRLHTELPGMGRDKLYRIGKILNGRIAAHVDPGAIPQHEHSVALFMQLVGRRAALFHLRGHGAAVAGHHQRVLAARLLAREIIQLHTPQ